MVARGVRVDLNCENVTAYCDEEKVRVMLDNLLSNAVKYSPERASSPSSSTRTARRPSSRSTTKAPASPPRAREGVRGLLPRTDAPIAAIKGSGLGLSIVKEYVQLHKGRIEVLDGPGARFRIRIPRRRDAGEAAA